MREAVQEYHHARTLMKRAMMKISYRIKGKKYTDEDRYYFKRKKEGLNTKLKKLDKFLGEVCR